jgi:hypothetical protein
VFEVFSLFPRCLELNIFKKKKKKFSLFLNSCQEEKKFPLKIQSLNQIRFHNLATRKANKTHLKTFPKKIKIAAKALNKIAGSCFMGYDL